MLVLSWPCSPEELETAYRAAVRRTHPDTGGNADEFKAAQTAYETLKCAMETTAEEAEACAMIAKAKGQNGYKVTWLPTDRIKPSPENDTMYGAIAPRRANGGPDRQHRPARPRGASVANRRPIRPIRPPATLRHAQLGWKEVPVRIQQDIQREGNPEFHRNLAEFNPQRIKSPGSLLREALLRKRTLRIPTTKSEITPKRR